MALKPKPRHKYFHLPTPEQKITIRELLDSRCHQYMNKIFLLDPEKGTQYSYKQFRQRVNIVSNFLFRQGLRKGDKVSLLMPNSSEFLWSLFAILQLGAIACPINTHLKAEEIAYILRNSDSKALLTKGNYTTVALKLFEEQQQTRRLYSWYSWNENAGSAGEKGPCKLLNMEMLLKEEPLELLPEIKETPLQPDDVAEIIYTSGTTGKPKGAMLTHHNIIIDAHWIAHWNRLREQDRAMCVMPLFHVNGQIVTVMTPLYHGGSVLLPGGFSVTRFFPLICTHMVTYTGTVATMLSMLLNRVNPRDIPADNKLRIVFCGSAPVPAKVQIEFEKTFKVPVIEGYGMTETTCRSTFNPLPPPGELRLGENDGYRKIGSAGLPLGNEMRVVDEQDRPLGPGEVGEIVIRGENVMKGYYKNEEATREAFRGGWFHSNDLGYYDEDGYFYIIDRKKDMIIRGGENIYPREIEEVLYKHPAVKDAVCIGIPDELYGEEVIAFIAFKDNAEVKEEEMLSFCRQYLADFKTPKQIMVIKEIPKSSSGKLLRRELREQWNNIRNSHHK